ncbi:MAG: SbcC/MukB-like Walker B domain-containing protein [Clostridiales bacterium]|nr:SbcC/MukB-like Walker B domain-containing protein [Clostridiales bacterium]
MKELKRMLLIHWHHYDKEVIDFEMINFLTGKTAAGKSTIIDALQLVLLGDTDGNFFNKAANQKSARTLKSYLYGELGDDGEAGFKYLRENTRFTSYVALEFYDTTKKSFFVTGIVCDCYKDQNFDKKWFVINGNGLPDEMFIDSKTSVPFTIQELTSFFKQSYGRKNTAFEFYDTNKRYQDVTLGKFGQIKPKYRMLLKKAVPFSPISDITQFITESICDIRNDISVDQMQSDIRLYKQLEQDAESTARRIEALARIRELDELYHRECNTYSIQEYIVYRAEQDEYMAVIAGLKEEVRKKKERIELLGVELQALEADRQEHISRLQTLQDEYGNSDIVRREQDLSKELSQLKKDIDGIESAIASAAVHLHGYAENWIGILERLTQDRNVSEELAAGFSVHMELLKEMQDITSETVIDFPVDKALRALSELHNAVSTEKSRVDAICKELTTKQLELRETIKALKNGIKPYRGNVVQFKAMLESRLSEESGKKVEVPVFADLLEVRDTSWQNAIEGYLDAQRFYLIVPEEYYHAALNIYDAAKAEHGYFDIGIVDIGKLKKEAASAAAVPGSLADEIESESEDALLYARYLLGKVMKCDSVHELNSHRTAITRSCMLYKNYVSRKLNPDRYATPFLGRKAINIQIQQNETALCQLTKLLEHIIETLTLLRRAAGLNFMNENEAADYKKAIGRNAELAELAAQRASKQAEYDSLDFLYMQKMIDEIERLKTDVKELEKPIQLRHDESIRLDEQIESILNTRIPEEENKNHAVQQRIGSAFAEDWISETGEPRYREEVERSKTGTSAMSLRERFSSAKAGTATRRENQRRERNHARSLYNQEYHMPYDAEREDNKEFSDELHSLQDIKLPDYLSRIQNAREKAYNQFRDDFIAKIKSNIESVTEQINELNESLRKHRFGTDSYRFEKKPRPEYRQYYDMIMDPMLLDTGGYNIMSELFNQKYRHEIAELFDMLIMNEMDMSAEKKAEYEKNIRKFTDYKTYLVFDLVVTNDHGEEQRLSKTLLKKSGGETQIPFYISLLASFSQVCRIRSKEPQNNTIRIIILDEAFSKMDGERIRECILLLRRFRLQAIFSAPPEKISDIAPLVDRNIAVYKDYRHSFTRYFDPKEIDTDLIEEE